MTTYALISLIPDDSALIQTRLILDPYRPQKVTLMEEQTVSEKVTETMTAKAARESGLDIDPAIPDEKTIRAEWMEDRTTYVEVKEIRLRYRHKSHKIVARRNRDQGIRPELAGAAINPYKLIQHKRLIELVEDEAKYWMNHNIGQRILTPLILILLSSKEQPDGSHIIGNRKTFLIKRYSEWHIQAEDDKGNRYEIDLDDGVVKAGLIRRFTLFLPTNASFRLIQSKNATEGD